MQAWIAKPSSNELRDAIDTFRSSSDKAWSTIIWLPKVLIALTVVVVVLMLALILIVLFD
jgi:hypothetical protein